MYTYGVHCLTHRHACQNAVTVKTKVREFNSIETADNTNVRRLNHNTPAKIASFSSSTLMYECELREMERERPGDRSRESNNV